MNATERQQHLLQRAVAAVDADLHAYISTRRGVHPSMLAMSVAGYTATLVATHYRAALTRTLHAAGPSAIDADVPHLVRDTDSDGNETVRIVEDAFDLRPMLHGLQLASGATIREAAAARTLARTVVDEAVGCVLAEMLAESSADALAALSDAAFAEQFRSCVRASEGCLGMMSQAALDYAGEVGRDAVARADLDALSLPDLERMLGLRPLDGTERARLLRRRPRRARTAAVEAVVPGDVAAVPINHATWALQNAIRDALLGRGWSDADGATAPAHETPTNHGRGAVRVSLRATPGDLESDADELPRLWEQVGGLNDLTSDALFVCLAHWSVASRESAGTEIAPIWVTADAILDARGIRRIRRGGEPDGWQHGHRREDRIAAGRALAQLDQLWLEVVDVEVAPARGRAAARHVNIESRTLAVLDRLTGRDDDGQTVFLAARVVPGDWIRAWSDAGLRQVGQLARQALIYDPYRERPEKWLAKYLAFTFRWNARRRAGHVRLRVVTLLENAALVPDSARPQRARDRLERALDRLRQDGIIAAWEYEGDPGLLPARGWLPVWQEMIVRVSPPTMKTPTLSGDG